MRRRYSIRQMSAAAQVVFAREPQWYNVLRSLPLGSVSTVFDVGANVGTFSMMARFLHPAAQIIAIEPHAATFHLLMRNVAGTDIKTLRAAFGNGHQFAYAGQRRRLSVYVRYMEATDQSDPDTLVPSYPLTEIFRFADHPLLSETFWKLDVEGAELTYPIRDRRSVTTLCTSAGFVLDIHGSGRRQWRFWRRKLGATHSLECWHRRRCCVIAARRQTPTVNVYLWRQSDRTYQEIERG